MKTKNNIARRKRRQVKRTVRREHQAQALVLRGGAWVLLGLFVLCLVLLVVIVLRPKETNDNDFALTPGASSLTTVEILLQQDGISIPYLVTENDGFLGEYLLNGELPIWITQQNIDAKANVAMYAQFFEPMDREIVSTYPITALREVFATAITDQTWRIRLTWASDMNFKLVAGKQAILIPPDDTSNVPTAHIFSEAFRSEQLFGAAAYYHDRAKAHRVVIDAYLLLVLHEYYHAHVQKTWKHLDMTYEDTLAYEADCWAYECSLIVVMQDYGRGSLVPDSAEAKLFSLYTTLKGDTAQPEWMKKIRELYPEA